ncbi:MULTISPECIES: hypothetical protein [unclassified Pseudofrankia]|uniref:SWIM zinc finger family protein n=1 Tax=unclassified Pseudofrankia TaxID=2994372 RepID=UPI0008DA3B66|nr:MULTISPECIES: hypothetical protein [unclassified Pseudofrankia]MDT3438040.1 hypothetical protein [Pseudofrankia sp. BMG5.37]OHV56769.1 hypothetical protein BCD48_06770 [Pseudofrankia sp. BMG5.36]
MTDPGARGGGGGRGHRGGRAWWSSRFLALIEGMSLPDPLRAGRVLVRTEAVLSVRRSGNLVVAMVRDQGEDLHKARLAVRTFGDADWRRVEDALASEARYAAALLAGSMPAGIEPAFAALGLSLFPTRADDLAMDCTCSDWQRPCAHLVAACHQLADTIDLDPFVLLALRGRERDALLGEIRRLRPHPAARAGRGTRTFSWPAGPGWPRAEPGPPDTPTMAATTATGPADEGAEPLPRSVSAFWSSPVPADRRGAASDRHAPAARPDILLELCGPLAVEPFGDLREALRPAYQLFTAQRRATSTQDTPRDPG